MNRLEDFISMKRITRIAFYLFLLIPTVQAENNSVKVEEFTQKVYSAWSQHKAFPLISEQSTKATAKQSYLVQQKLIKQIINSNHQLEISGFKAGLTSNAGQQRFKVSGPVYGVLFNHGLKSSDDPVKLSAAFKLMLETEIGFITNQSIDSPLHSVHQLQSLIESIVPVIELPDLAFADVKKVTGKDIIATNVASHQYIVGEAVRMPVDFSLNQLVIQLHINDSNSPILTGKGSDASGDQWMALLELINHQIKSGYKIRPGQLFITGALGKMIPASIGEYHANFGPLGQIQFEVTE